MKKQIKIILSLAIIIIIGLAIYINKVKTNKVEDAKFRVISVGGGLTEIIYKLKVEKFLVGIDTSSYFPKETNSLAKVGYQRTLAIEGLLALNPNVIFLNTDAGPRSVIEQLKKLKINVVELKNKSLEDLKKNIKIIGETLKVSKQNINQVLKSLDKDLAKLKAKVSEKKEKKKVMFILGHGHVPIVAGRNTSANTIIELSGAENLMNKYNSYKPLNPEALLALKPDFIIFSTKNNNKQALEKFINKFSIDKSLSSKIIVIDSLFALGFGPRIVEAALKLHSHYWESDDKAK